jgi:RHS repeat-associated protein
MTVGVSVTPANGVDGVNRVENTTGNQVTFTVTNTGTEDTRYDRSCVGTGSVSIVDCSYITGIVIPGEQRTVTATFITGNAGTGTVQLTVTSSQPPGASATGTWTETVVRGAQVTPDGDAVVENASTAYSSNFTITNKESAQMSYNLAAVCSGSGVANCSANPTSVTLNGSAWQAITVNYTTQTGAATGIVELQAQLMTSAANNFASGNVITAAGGTAQVTLDPAAATDNNYTVHYYTQVTATAPGSGQQLSRSTLVVALESNDGSGWVERTTFSYLAVADISGPVTNSWSHEQKTITVSGLGQNDFIRLKAKTFTHTGGGSGSFKIRGGDAAGSNPETYNGVTYTSAGVTPVVTDKGWLSVTVLPAPAGSAPVVDVASVNSGDIVARQQCLTIALAAAAASECGDLRIVHALPSIRTMNRWRSPTLVYSSAQAIGWTSVAANVTLPGSAVPSTVSAVLKIGGVIKASGSWTGSQWAPASTRRIALGFSAPAQGLTTGIYDYILEVTRVYADSAPMTSASGKLTIVDRSASYFGAGWWLAGLEKWSDVTAVWMGGDGSVRQYVLRPGSVAPNRVWGAPSLTYPDSIRELNGEFVRQLPDSVWVYFDVQGRHVRTRNRLGHLTTFAYDASSRLSTITVPPASSPLSYTFSYDGNGRLSTVVAPGDGANRSVTFTVDAATGRLTTVLEPENRTVSFGYSGDNKIAARTDRRGTITSFVYDAGNRVSQASINLQPGTITRTVQQAQSQGSAGIAVALTNVFTRLDGPRSVNTTSFYLNRFGAADSIIDALGQRTRLLRTDTRFLAAVTYAIGVTGYTTVATYDDRGRILTLSAPGTSDPGTATTTYQWDPKWDEPTRITNPEGDLTDFGVDAVTGNRIWEQPSTLGQTTFGYNGDNQVTSVTAPSTPARVYTYDAKGNLQTDTSPLGMLTTWTNNGIGLTTQIQTPTGTSGQTGWGPYQIETVGYSVRNEEMSRATSIGSENTTVNKTYDEEGNLLSVTRSFAPNQGTIGSLVTSWTYDRANRQNHQTEPDGTIERRGFDEAGNLVADTTRRNFILSMTYDALNRLQTRAIPAFSLSLPASQIFPATAINGTPYTYSWTADNQAFGYSPDGQVTSATNKDATVARVYHPSGRLIQEQLDIKYTDRTNVHSYITSYTYDRDGRRSSVRAPVDFAGVPIRYTYSPYWGGVTMVTDIASNAFNLWYTPRGELQNLDYGGGIRQSYTYDNDGRISADFIANGVNTAFPYWPGTTMRSFAVTSRNARGQILASSESVMSDQVTATYSGLGNLMTSSVQQAMVNGITGAPTSYSSEDTQTNDGLGNLITTTTHDYINGQFTSKNGANTYTSIGRLNTRALGVPVTTYSYDLSGNAYFESTFTTPNITSERAAYHAPDEKLVATDTRASGRLTLEEYRYDALGRRIWVRSVKSCEGGGKTTDCFAPYVRRTIWDGAQELAEIQIPADGTSAEELDVGYAVRPFEPSANDPATGSTGDPNPYYGRVVYGPGLAIDKPLSVTRYDYRDKPTLDATPLSWPRFSWQIYWNYQGMPAYGTLTSGAWANPYQVGQNQTSCPVLGDQTTQRCVLIQWPSMRSAYDQNRGNVPIPSWHGSLLEGKRDRSGLEYRRNRQYDPSAGRFTQEDPIGLAGGLNAYGFAAGDPITFSDPFGLCGHKGEEPCPQTPLVVTVNSRAAQIPGGKALDAVGADHQWFTTNTGISVGMGTATGVPKSDAPLVDTYVVDHTGQVPTSTTTYTNVDKAAFMSYTKLGTPLGAWAPGLNDCNTWVSLVLQNSTPHDIMVVSTSPIGAAYGGYFGGFSTTTYHNVVQYADGSIHRPGGP